MYKARLDELTIALQSSWSAETSSSSMWSEANPALGQCAVTACIIYDYLGGDILSSKARLPDGSVESHYFNIIDGNKADLTLQQFPAGTVISEGEPKAKGYASTRDFCLSFESTRSRYELLKERVERQLQG